MNRRDQLSFYSSYSERAKRAREAEKGREKRTAASLLAHSLTIYERRQTT